MRKLLSAFVFLSVFVFGSSQTMAMPMDVVFNVDPGSTVNVSVDGIGDIGTVDVVGTMAFSVDGDEWTLTSLDFGVGDLLGGLVVDIVMSYPFAGSTPVIAGAGGGLLTFAPTACPSCTNLEAFFSADASAVGQGIVTGQLNDVAEFNLSEQNGLKNLDADLSFDLVIIAPATINMDLSLTQIPEPSTIALAGGGLIALLVAARRRAA